MVFLSWDTQMRGPLFLWGKELPILAIVRGVHCILDSLHDVRRFGLLCSHAYVPGSLGHCLSHRS